MISKKAVDHIEAICSIPGLDMVQFGSADFSMSLGWNSDEYTADCRAAEWQVIKAALRHGVAPRCQIQNLADAQYYIDLGVKHFCYGDQVAKLRQLWVQEGKQMRDLANALDQTPECIWCPGSADCS